MARRRREFPKEFKCILSNYTPIISTIYQRRAMVERLAFLWH
jgi:hypothetical protein